MAADVDAVFVPTVSGKATHDLSRLTVDVWRHGRDRKGSFLRRGCTAYLDIVGDRPFDYIEAVRCLRWHFQAR